MDSKDRKFLLLSEARSRMRTAADALRGGDCVKAWNEAGIVAGISMAVSTFGDDELLIEVEGIQEELYSRFGALHGGCTCPGLS